MSLCDTCLRADCTCPIYPQNIKKCVEYIKDKDLIKFLKKCKKLCKTKDTREL